MNDQAVNPALLLAVDQYRAGAIGLNQARELIRAWPAYLPSDLSQKARALRILAITTPAERKR